MKLERIKSCKHRIFQRSSILESHWRSIIYLGFASLLFCFIANNRLVASSNKESLLPFLERAIIKELNSIENPYERGGLFLAKLYGTSLKTPSNVGQLTNNVKTLWSDNFPYKEALKLIGEAELQKSKGTFHNSSNNTLKAIQIIESQKPKDGYQKHILCLAYVFFARYSKYTKEKEGINYAYKALELATAIDFPFGKVLAHNQIGIFSGYFNKNYELSLKHFEAAKKLLVRLSENQSFIKGFILGNIAKTWSEIGDIEKSIKYKEEMLAEIKSHENLELVLGTYNNLGSNYFSLKKYDLAEKYLQKTLDLMDQHQVYTNKGVPLLRIGLIRLEEGKITEAIVIANEIDLWQKKYQFIGDYEVMHYQFKSKIAKANQDYEQAIFWLEKAATKQQSLNKMFDANRLVKFEQKNKIQAIEQELYLLSKEKELNKATIQSQRIKLFTAALITFFAMLFSFILYHQKRELKEAYDFILFKDNGVELTNKQTLSPQKKIDKVLKLKIETALIKDKLYLDPHLTLKKFADQVNSNTSYVSKTINEGFDKNFSTLINDYRVQEIISLFHAGQHKLYTIESIYQKAGFKSKSSFQKAFKSKLGVTATHYLAHISQIPQE